MTTGNADTSPGGSPSFLVQRNRGPRQAGVYEAAAAGKDARAAERAIAAGLKEIFPGLEDLVVHNRRFLQRAVKVLAMRGVRQFLDLGAGYPDPPHQGTNLHQVAQGVTPCARMVYVDYEPVARQHLSVHCGGPGVAAILADIRTPEAVLDHPMTQAVLDPEMPTGVIFGSMMHFLTHAEVQHVLGVLRERLAHGSNLVVSHATPDGMPKKKITAATELYEDNVSPIHMRTAEEINDLLPPGRLGGPGLVRTYEWGRALPELADDMADMPRPRVDDDTPHLYAAVVPLASPG
ncbi:MULTISPECIES: SAM-dependent methyltransferase [unclassified Nonomuraea]|uniref:SAM-dependent methyltransferase n=1 Tax=unclassified Nonomuraea TaxID=2593643 RepID=UPI0034086848